MGIVDECLTELKVDKYYDHACSMSVSPQFLYNNHPSYCLQPDKMIIRSSSKEDFEESVKQALECHGKIDFYDFSLALGTIIGTYNVYLYQFLSEDMKKQIVDRTNDSVVTKEFLQYFEKDFMEYFQRFYNIDASEYQGVVTRMFDVTVDYSMYSNPICLDVGKMLLASNFLFDFLDNGYFTEDVSYLISSGELLEEFDKINGRDKMVQKSISIDKRGKY